MPLLVVVTVQSGLRSPPIGYFSKSSQRSALAGQPGPEVTGSGRSEEPSLAGALPSRGAVGPSAVGWLASGVELPPTPPTAGEPPEPPLPPVTEPPIPA